MPPTDKISRALIPTNRELKTHLNNTQLLYARKVASTMPPYPDKEWEVVSAWAVSLKEEAKEWLKNSGPEWINKRQLVMILIAEAAALHQEIVDEEK